MRKYMRFKGLERFWRRVWDKCCKRNFWLRRKWQAKSLHQHGESRLGQVAEVEEPTSSDWDSQKHRSPRPFGSRNLKTLKVFVGCRYTMAQRTDSGWLRLTCACSLQLLCRWFASVCLTWSVLVSLARLRTWMLACSLHTLDKKWIIAMTQWELNPCHAKPEKTMNSK